VRASACSLLDIATHRGHNCVLHGGWVGGSAGECTERCKNHANLCGANQMDRPRGTCQPHCRQRLQYQLQLYRPNMRDCLLVRQHPTLPANGRAPIRCMQAAELLILSLRKETQQSPCSIPSAHRLIGIAIFQDSRCRAAMWSSRWPARQQFI
jgi:hypothetical protein